MKSVDKDWGVVQKELAEEELKVASYDQTMIPLMGDLNGKMVLDYGSGPAKLAQVLLRLGADVRTYDKSSQMNGASAAIIGGDRVYLRRQDIPAGKFDFVVCNLVLCIVPWFWELLIVIWNVKRALKSDGKGYIGFCTPRLLRVEQTNLDVRHTGRMNCYHLPHSYIKTKKEGGYKITERHRPLWWYIFFLELMGLKIVRLVQTPEYEFIGQRIHDFVILEVCRN